MVVQVRRTLSDGKNVWIVSPATSPWPSVSHQETPVDCSATGTGRQTRSFYCRMAHSSAQVPALRRSITTLGWSVGPCPTYRWTCPNRNQPWPQKSTLDTMHVENGCVTNRLWLSFLECSTNHALRFTQSLRLLILSRVSLQFPVSWASSWSPSSSSASWSSSSSSSSSLSSQIPLLFLLVLWTSVLLILFYYYCYCLLLLLLLSLLLLSF